MYEWIYDANGEIAAMYDTATNAAYYLSGDPMISNGVPVTFDPSSGEYTAQDSSGGTVSPNSPPAGVASSDWLALFSDAAPKILTGVQAWQLAQINVKRASQGLPPLNAALYAPGQAGFMANMSSQGMMLGIAAVAAILLFSGKRGKA